jgi:hypothetical protein
MMLQTMARKAFSSPASVLIGKPVEEFHTRGAQLFQISFQEKHVVDPWKEAR